MTLTEAMAISARAKRPGWHNFWVTDGGKSLVYLDPSQREHTHPFSPRTDELSATDWEAT